MPGFALLEVGVRIPWAPAVAGALLLLLHVALLLLLLLLLAGGRGEGLVHCLLQLRGQVGVRANAVSGAPANRK